MLALQGPDARAILARHLEGEAPARMRTARARVAGVDCLVCGTGYTGEDGVELLMAPDDAAAVWDALTGEGATPAGLGARDTLRLEVCFHLYGNDLSEDRNPIEAGLGWCCKLDTGLHRRGRAARRRAGRAPGAVRLHRAGHPAPRQRGPHRGGHGGRDERHAVAVPGDRDRDGLRAGRRGRARHPDRGGRARQAPRRRGARAARSTKREETSGGRRDLPRRT